MGQIPVAGKAVMKARIISVIDKGEHAVLENEVTVRVGDSSGPLLGRTYSSVHVSGAGGFAASKQNRSADADPVSTPDACINYQIAPDQALLYRLSGDLNPLHSDPAFAQARGFPKPILHGLCTFGFACRALLEALDKEGAQMRSMSARFQRPVYPGDELTCEIWMENADSARFRTINSNGQPVLDAGSATFSPR